VKKVNIIKSGAPELLAPAGDLQKLKTALTFGADAVYFGLPGFSLRARVNKFSKEDIRKGAEICRKQNKKFYVTINIYAHNLHLKALPDHLEFINEIKPNAVILSDPGVLRMVKKYCPEIPIHISTQVNATNLEAVKFWAEQGVERIILAREVTLDEIREIKQEAPKIELEVFVHGAMCMAYSGRCLLSKWMTGRSANLGDCAQPCRWMYNKTNSEESLSKGIKNSQDKIESIVDDKKRFLIDVEEDQHGSYFFNSYDLCLIEYLDKLAEAGIDSFKIEGRGKSVYYVAVTTRAYRKVLDALNLQMTTDIKEDKNLAKIITKQKRELERLSHRGFWTGFLLKDEPPHLTERSYLPTNWEFVGISVDKKTNDGKKRQVFVHNQLAVNEEVEVITPTENQKNKIIKIANSKGVVLEKAHGGQNEIFNITFEEEVSGDFLLRKDLT